MEDRLYITSEADRLTVAAILVKNKYTVRQDKRRVPGKKSYEYYVEYEMKQETKPTTGAKENGDEV